MKKKLFVYICLLLLASSCKDKKSVFENYEYCNILSKTAICTDFRLPKEAPKTCMFTDKDNGVYMCPMEYMFGYAATNPKDLTDMRLKALRIENELRKLKRELLLCRGI